MDQNIVLLLVYVAVALIVATVIMFFRDLAGRRAAKVPQREPGTLDVTSLLPPPESAVPPQDESWLSRLTTETGSDFTADTALLLAVLIGLALGGTLYLWRDDWLAGAAGAIIGVLAVGGLLFYLRFRRRSAIREQLPDVTDLMARAVRAGESLDQAITLAGESGLKPVATEFHYCARQMTMGLSLESAVRRLVGPAPLAETRILAMTLIVQRRRGGSLPTTLERLARVLRDRSNFYRQFQAASAMGRASAIVIAVVALGLDAFVVLGHSEYAAVLLTTTTGRLVLATSLLLQVVGVSWALWLFRSQL
jgi:tight adherence protein B